MKVASLGRTAALSVMFSACAMPAFAQSTTTLTFEGLGNRETVNQFYNGGTGGNGSGPGTNYGVSFSANALALIDSDAGGSGNFGGEPSPDTILFFQSGAAATLNVPAGFTTGFSFYYASPVSAGTVIVYDGPNAIGNVLATISLPTTPNNGAPDPTGSYSPFLPYGVSFSGTARSVDFGGSAGNIGFDNITLGASSPVDPGDITCASEGYTGTKLLWCKNICEKGYTGATLDTWIHRWVNRYRDLPYCAVEGGEEPPPPPQEG